MRNLLSATALGVSLIASPAIAQRPIANEMTPQLVSQAIFHRVSTALANNILSSIPGSTLESTLPSFNGMKCKKTFFPAADIDRHDVDLACT